MDSLKQCFEIRILKMEKSFINSKLKAQNATNSEKLGAYSLPQENIIILNFEKPKRNNRMRSK